MLPPDIPSLRKVRHRSADHPVGERFERWQAVIAGSYDDATGPRSASDDAAFEVDSSMWNLGRGLLFNARLRGRQVKHRSQRRIRADQLDHYRVHVQRRGCERNDAQGRVNEVRPGDVLITDMSREERYELEESECTVLVVPREMLDEALPRPMDLHGAMPRGSAARLLANHLAVLADGADKVAEAEAPALMNAMVQMLAAALAGTRDARLDAAPPVAPSSLRQLCRYIDLHLSEPELCGDDLCEAFDMSRTALYRLFSPLGGVNRFIRERRLHRIHEALRTSDARVNLARLAADHGFSAASHFSRAFREQFGYSPREVQRMGAAAAPTAGRAGEGKSVEMKAAEALDQWLRGLRD